MSTQLRVTLTCASGASFSAFEDAADDHRRTDTIHGVDLDIAADQIDEGDRRGCAEDHFESRVRGNVERHRGDAQGQRIEERVEDADAVLARRYRVDPEVAVGVRHGEGVEPFDGDLRADEGATVETIDDEPGDGAVAGGRSGGRCRGGCPGVAGVCPKADPAARVDPRVHPRAHVSTSHRVVGPMCLAAGIMGVTLFSDPCSPDGPARGVPRFGGIPDRPQTYYSHIVAPDSAVTVTLAM